MARPSSSRACSTFACAPANRSRTRSRAPASTSSTTASVRGRPARSSSTDQERTAMRTPAHRSALRAAATPLATLVVTGSPLAAHPRTGAQNLGDPDYGVCRGPDPDCYHDWGNFNPAVDGYKALLYTHTAAPRPADRGPALGPGLDPPLTAANVVQNAIVALGAANGFAVHYTEDVTQLATPGQLFKYNAVIFFSTSRDTLDDAAQTSLRQYLRGGGGFVGIHNA